MEELAGLQVSMGPILISLAVVIVILLVISLILRERRKVRARHQRLISLGFEPISTSPSALRNRVADLYRRRDQHQFRIDNVFRRTILGGEMWVFDLTDTGGSETTTIGTGIVAITSPELDLPRLLIGPTLEGSTSAGLTQANGIVGKLTSRLIDWAASRSGMQRVDLSDAPEFQRRYLVLATDDLAARRVLTPERRDRLLSLERNYEIVMLGDTLAIRPQIYGRTTQMREPYALDLLLEDAKLLFDYLR